MTLRWIHLFLGITLFLAAFLTADNTLIRANSGGPVYLPIVGRKGLTQPVFAVQSNHLSRDTIAEAAKSLDASWVRIQGLSWGHVQTQRSSELNWQMARTFEQDVLAANKAGMTPAVVIWDSPAWATINKYKVTSCGAVRDDRFVDFAAFLSAAVRRYSQPPFNVRYWELGNEPDVDPRLPSTNAVWGCWGDADDDWYGGEHYGRMLNAVAPAIRAADPESKIVFGGLLLDRPDSSDGNYGHPERFFEGALRVDAARSFDIVAFHSYAGYAGYATDTDLLTNNVWPSDLGRVRGKAAFLRSVMARHGVNKPIWANEIGLICFYCDEQDGKDDPPQGFVEAQADILPRLYSRAMSVNVQQVAWYMLEDSSWMFSSLMDRYDKPRPAYYAYQELIRRVGNGPVAVDEVGDYGKDIEAYRFSTTSGTIDLAWSNSYKRYKVQVPAAAFKGAYARDGAELETSTGDGQVSVLIGFSPVYIVRNDK